MPLEQPMGHGMSLEPQPADESVEVMALFEATDMDTLVANGELFRSTKLICVDLLHILKPAVLRNNIHVRLATSAQTDPDPASEALLLLDMTIDTEWSTEANAILGGEDATHQQKRIAASAFLTQLHRVGPPPLVILSYQTFALELVGIILRAQENMDSLLEASNAKELAWEKEKANLESRIAQLEHGLKGRGETSLVDTITELEEIVDHKERMLTSCRLRISALETRCGIPHACEVMGLRAAAAAAASGDSGSSSEAENDDFLEE